MTCGTPEAEAQETDEDEGIWRSNGDAEVPSNSKGGSGARRTAGTEAPAQCRELHPAATQGASDAARRDAPTASALGAHDGSEAETLVTAAAGVPHAEATWSCWTGPMVREAQRKIPNATADEAAANTGHARTEQRMLSEVLGERLEKQPSCACSIKISIPQCCWSVF